MSDGDDSSPRPTTVKSRLDELIERILSEHPRLVLPAVILFGLFGLVTIGKTLFEMFVSIHKEWKLPGVAVAALIVLALLILAIRLVHLVLASRPVVQRPPRHYLSRSPRVRWEYADGPQAVRYEVRAKALDTGAVTVIRVPERMHQIGISGISGAVEIRVDALIDGKKVSSSRPVTTEIYRDSVQRIRETGKLRVAVHADAGEEIFCFVKNGEWEGFDIRFLERIAAELGRDPNIGRQVKVEPSFYEWPAVIMAPNGHEVDMAIASISRTEERVRQYGIAFSRPYAESMMGVIAYRRVFPGFEFGKPVSLDALKGKTVAVHDDTTARKFLEQAREDDRYRDIQVRYAPNNDELRALLRDNAVNAVVHDYYRAITLLEAGTVVCVLEHDIPVEKDEYGIVFSRVNAVLQDKVDAIIVNHRSTFTSMLDQCMERKRRAIESEGSDAGSAITQYPTGRPKTNLFVYGSLMYEDVWRRLVSREFRRVPARLDGYRRLRIKGEDYPGLVKGPGGAVHGIVWLDVDEETLKRIDRFEAECYRRVSGRVVDDAGVEMPADFFEVKKSHMFLVEEVEWDLRKFEQSGLARFLAGYAGFKG